MSFWREKIKRNEERRSRRDVGLSIIKSRRSLVGIDGEYRRRSRPVSFQTILSPNCTGMEIVRSMVGQAGLVVSGSSSFLASRSVRISTVLAAIFLPWWNPGASFLCVWENCEWLEPKWG